MQDHMPITLDEMCDGAAVEIFDEALTEIKADIEKASKKTTARRAFTMEFGFEPTENGCGLKYTIKRAKTTLAPSREAVGFAQISRAHGQMEILDIHQTEPDSLRSNVIPHPGNKE